MPILSNKKGKHETQGVKLAAYTGLVSRYLDVTGQQVHDTASSLSKQEQERNKFSEIIEAKYTRKRKGKPTR